MTGLRAIAGLLLATMPAVAAAQQPAPQRPAQPPSQPETRRQFCDHSMAEMDTLVTSINAAFRGRGSAQRDAARLTGQAGAEEARQRSDHWRRMIDELSTELQKWTLVRAGMGCPPYGQ